MSWIGDGVCSDEIRRQQSCFNRSQHFPPGSPYKCRGGSSHTVYKHLEEVIQCCNSYDFCNLALTTPSPRQPSISGEKNSKGGEEGKATDLSQRVWLSADHPDETIWLGVVSSALGAVCVFGFPALPSVDISPNTSHCSLSSFYSSLFCLFTIFKKHTYI